MKSDEEQLMNRGYLATGDETPYLDRTFNEKVAFLKSRVPIDRTLGARLLLNSKDSKAISFLISALIVEKNLYPKVEICNSLFSCGEDSIKPLVKILGKVGKNQHKVIPEDVFDKDSYPLPRDIAGRTLIRFGQAALSELEKVLGSKEIRQLCEAIDAVGFICFYDCKPEVFEKLKKCYLKNSQNSLIKWKIICAMSGFPESESFLLDQKNKIDDERIKKEIERSVLLIKTRKLK